MVLYVKILPFDWAQQEFFDQSDQLNSLSFFFFFFVFTDQTYLTETNAAIWFVLIMCCKLHPHLMFLPILVEKDYSKP